MRKVIKILLKLIPTVVLLLIVVPLILSILLTIPAIQNRLLVRATTFATEFLGTRVSIGNINVGAFGKLKFTDFYVEDYQRDTLMYVERLDLHILLIGIKSRQIKIGHAQIDGGVLQLRQTADSVLNIKPIMDHLTPDIPAQKNMVVSFGNLKVSGLDVSIDMLQHRNPEYGIDYGDMLLGGLTAEVHDLTIDGPTVYTSIKSLSFLERSGFELTSMSGDLYLTNGVIGIENGVADSRFSHLNFPSLSIVGTSWADYKDFINKVDIGIKVEETTVSSDDVAYFSPKLRNWGIMLSDLEMEVEGEVCDLDIDVVGSKFASGSAIAFEMNITELPDFRSSNITAQLRELVTNPSDISYLVDVISGEELPASSQEIVDRLGELHAYGVFRGKLLDFVSSVEISSSWGVVESDISISELNNGQHILDGNITTNEVDMGQIFNNKNVGRVSLYSTLKGDIGNLKELAVASGEISNLELRGERFYDIPYSLSLRGGELRAEVSSQNEGLNFDLEATINMQDERMGYDVSAELNDLDFEMLHINRRDSVSHLAAHLTAVGSGNNIDEFIGEISISNGTYTYNQSTISADSITLKANNTERQKSFVFTSEFADVTYRSRDSYRESIDFLRNSFRSYLPAIYPTYRAVTINSDEEHNSSNHYSMLSVETKDLTPITQAFVSEGMQISNDSRLNLMYNSHSRDLSMSVSAQYVELNSLLAIDLNVDCNNTADSLAVSGSIHELLVGTRQFENLKIFGGAKENRVKVNAGYTNSKNLSSTSLGFLALLSNDPMRGIMAKVRILPSQITQGDEEWEVKARTIEIDRDGVTIDRFMIQNEAQELRIEGLASRSEEDTLRVNMQNFDLSILSAITQSLGYDVEGVTNGDVVVSSALYNMRVDANVALDSVSINSLPTPPIRIRAAWDTHKNQARISLTDREKGDTIILGYYIPSGVKYYARLDVDSLHLGILDAPLKGILTNTTGYADAHIVISGERRNAELEGYVDIKGMESRVAYTNVKYRVPDTRVQVKDNELTCQNAPIFDTLGNRGVMTLSVDLQHLSNIAYKVRLNVEDILALNTTARDNELFYGQMYTTGVVDLVGNKLGVNMDITATTMDNSEFFMPLSNTTDISTAEFITFLTPQSIVDSTDIVTLKRRSFESDQRKKSASGGNLNINMSLNITPDAEFQLVIDPTVGDIIKGSGEGRLNLRVNPQSNIFNMYGDYTITEGSYLFTLRNIINKRFVIDSGSTIQWTGDPINPILNIEAIYKLKTSLQPLISDESTRAVPVDCTIKLQDRLLQPEVSFAISLPTGDSEQQTTIANLLNDQESVSRQFFYLMLANSFISETSSGSDLGISTTTSTGFELLTNQLSNWLSSSNYNVVIRYRPESELTGDELDFGISRSLINNRLLVEVEGNYSNEISDSGESEAMASNFTGEAYITWLIDRSGALKLRGFTQTIDRYDENQGLQETGIGIYYKESFNNFKDLCARIKARFSRKGVAIKSDDD